jgi:Peptidase inhibitor family I36
MKTFSAFALGLLFSLALAPQSGAAPQFGSRDRVQGRDRVCVYQDINFQGWEQCYSVSDEVTSLGGRKKAISSIRVYGRARVTVWEDPEFKGHSAEFTSDVPDLKLRSLAGGHTWNDQIESLRVTSDSDSRRDDRRDDSRRDDPLRRTNRITDGVCVYDRQDFGGREQCFGLGTNVGDLGRAGNWSDRISSIRVFGRAAVVVYRDIEFRGENIVVDRDVPDLGQISGRGFRSWDRQISSLAVESDRGRGRARGRF